MSPGQLGASNATATMSALAGGWSRTKGGVKLIISTATTLPGLGLERAPNPLWFRSHTTNHREEGMSRVDPEPTGSQNESTTN